MLSDSSTLVDCRLPSNARLQLHLAPARPSAARGLKRVRIASTCLRTRQITVEEWTTVGSLKGRIADALRLGEQVWYTSDGHSHSKTGVTVLAAESAKPDPKQGTSNVRMGDELLVEGGPDKLTGGKGPVNCFRALRAPRRSHLPPPLRQPPMCRQAAPLADL